ASPSRARWRPGTDPRLASSPEEARRPCTTSPAAASRASATPSTARRTAASTPRSCSGWGASPGAAHCSTTCRPRPRPTRSKRYRNDDGQLLEHSPYSQRDLHAPELREPILEHGDYVIHVRSTDRITAYHYHHHPFDVVGWDGYLWPFRFDIADFQPITGRVHQPPPVHQTFQARNVVVCSFVPRKFDYHPLAIPAPYNHSNINSDEVIYYVAGNFMSRRGV